MSVLWWAGILVPNTIGKRWRATANAVFDFLDANCDDREIVDQLREALAGTEKV